jgi:glycosyltransferase involved in cell wall biosynthesis
LGFGKAHLFKKIQCYRPIDIKPEKLKKKLAIITTHPIQYNAPFFRLLAKSNIVQPKVFYTWGKSVLKSKYDPDFGKAIEWDIPLLEGYEYEFLENAAKDKGSHHFNGIKNPHLLKRIKDWNPDAILVYGWKFRSHIKVMRYFQNKVALWFRGDSTLLDEKKDFKSIFKTLWLKWLYGHIDLAFYAGTNNKAYFLNYGLKDNQLIEAFHAVENERFQNKDKKYSARAKQKRQELNIAPDSIVFLYAGKLSPKKNVETLLKAFKHLSSGQAHLLIVGNGPLESNLKTTYGSGNNVTFHDFQNQSIMPVIYQMCDVFVLPSTGPGESWGLAVNEAMASGKPVIVSDKCGCAKDLVENGKNGFIFKSGKSDELSSKMKSMIENKNQMASFGKESLAIISKFTFQGFVSAIENSISSLG